MNKETRVCLLDNRSLFAALTRAQAGFEKLRPPLTAPHTFRKRPSGEGDCDCCRNAGAARLSP
jgi:hypothetical protein